MANDWLCKGSMLARTRILAELVGFALVFALMLATTSLAQSEENSGRPSQPQREGSDIPSFSKLSRDVDDTLRLIERLFDNEATTPTEATTRFLINVERTLFLMSDQLKTVEGLHRRLLTEGRLSDQETATLEEYRKVLGELQLSARGLHLRLGLAVPGMEREKELVFENPSDDKSAELAFIREQLETVEAQFRRAPGQIKQASNEETILVCLSWINEMARQLQQQ